MFCKKGVFRNFAKYTGKHLCQRLFFNKVAEACKKETLAQVFLNFAKFLRTLFFRTPPVTASVDSRNDETRFDLWSYFIMRSYLMNVTVSSGEALWFIFIITSFSMRNK